MELWRVQRTYRLASRRLRGLGLHREVGDELVRLEASAACALAWSDRVATELAVRRLALRSARARLRRVLRTLRGTRLLSVELPGLTRGDPELTAGAVEAWLVAREHPELAGVLGQLRGELLHQAGRAAEVERRLAGALDGAERAVRRLALALEALPLRRA